MLRNLRAVQVLLGNTRVGGTVRYLGLQLQDASSIAENIVENGQTTPIQVRIDGDGYILVEGLHRLEALRALGETMVEAYIVRARLH